MTTHTNQTCGVTFEHYAHNIHTHMNGDRMQSTKQQEIDMPIRAVYLMWMDR